MWSPSGNAARKTIFQMKKKYVHSVLVATKFNTQYYRMLGGHRNLSKVHSNVFSLRLIRRVPLVRKGGPTR